MSLLPLVFTLLAQSAAPPAAPSAGPMPPELKNLPRLRPMSMSLANSVRTTVKDLGNGAVVVVEDTLPHIGKVKVPTTLNLGGKLRIFNGGMPSPTAMPVLSWMDTNTVYSGGTGGNVVSRSYPMGWGF